MVYSQIAQEQLYKTFMEVYSSVEFGSQHLIRTIWESVIVAKNEGKITQTKKCLESFPEKIRAYRVVGNQSNPNGFSYTLNKNVAVLFCCRNDDFGVFQLNQKNGVKPGEF